jgi:tetratricopeptide (TPR) repeat protein
MYSAADRAELRQLLGESEARYLEAAEEFRAAEEELNAAYALYNLANYLRSAYRFTKAKSYLDQALALAEKYGDQRLLKNMRGLEKSIRAKNRDIPNYAAGERRSQED